MKKELKTLQDLEIIPTLLPTDKGSYPCNDEIVEAKSLIVTKELRDLAIQWVRQDIARLYRRLDIYNEKEPDVLISKILCLPEIQRWQDRFNLAREDLK